MTTRLTNVYEEGLPAILHYRAETRDGAFVSLQMVFDSRSAPALITDGGSLSLQSANGSIGLTGAWTTQSGTFEVTASGEERLTVLVEDLTLVETTTREVRVVPAGTITGQLERVCIKRLPNPNLVAADGTPTWIYERDHDWSSPFCQSQR